MSKWRFDLSKPSRRRRRGCFGFDSAQGTYLSRQKLISNRIVRLLQVCHLVLERKQGYVADELALLIAMWAFVRPAHEISFEVRLVRIAGQTLTILPI